MWSMRSACPEEWVINLSNKVRRDRLLEQVDPEALIEKIQSEASNSHSIDCQWEVASNCPEIGFGRFKGIMPISDAIYDQFFNGISGIRAQYYLSVEEGVLFNRVLVDALVPIMLRKCLNICRERVIFSLNGQQAKIWIDDDNKAFGSALDNELQVPRWLSTNHAYRSRIPLPSDSSLLLMGTFCKPDAQKYWFVEGKKFRACDIHRQGSS